MVRFILCSVLLVVGAYGKEILVSDDSIWNEELTELKDDIPIDIPVRDEDTETIPTNGNIAIKNVEHALVTG